MHIFSIFQTPIINKKNRVFKLQDIDVRWITSHPELKDVVKKNHFTGLFQSTSNRDFSRLISLVPYLISEEVNNSLCKAISNDKILKAVKQLGALKAPEKDGYPGFIFRKYCDIVGAKFFLQ